MRILSTSVVTFGLICMAATTLHADDYIKDGKLTNPLKITQTQGGFAGFTGVEYTIEPDGAWSTATVFNQKKTPKDKGKLSAKELETLAALLSKQDLLKLPAKIGKQPGANPHTISIEFGKAKASIVGQMPPKADPNDAATPESRFAAIYQGVTAMLKTPSKKDAGK
jgi:hypothetical protein